MKTFCICLIRLYQLCLSPFFGTCCRFAPSCSEYAKEAILEYGVIKGSWLTLKRLAKCGPWHQGGYDPVIADVIADVTAEPESLDFSPPE